MKPEAIKRGVPVVWRERPFVGTLQRRVVLPEPRVPTIAEIVATSHPLPHGFDRFGEVRVNGDLVPRALWHLVRPRYQPGRETVVSLHVPMKGGGGGGGGAGGQGGGKSPIATIATIALLLVAAAASAGVGGGLLGALVATGITIGGTLLINALVPPPSLTSPSEQQSAAALAGNSDPAAKSPSAAALSGNVLSPGSATPRVIGTMRVFPPLLCNPLIEVIGDQEFAEAVFGLAGPHELDDVRVGGTATDSIVEVVTELVEGRPGDAVQSLVPRQSYTNTANAELSAHVLDQTQQSHMADQVNPVTGIPQAQTFTSRTAPDEIWVNIAWPEGLFKGDSLTTKVNVAVRIQIRLRGASTYIKLPEAHFSMNTPGSFQKVVRLKWGTIPVAQSTPATDQAPVYVFKHAPGQSSPATTDWDADSHFSAGSGNDVLQNATFFTTKVRNVELYDDKVIFYLDEATFPKGVYEIQVLRSAPYDNSLFVTSSYQYNGTVTDFFYYQLSGGTAVIPVDHAQFHDRMVVSRVSSIWNENPVQSAHFATVSIKVHSRSLDSLSVRASGLITDLDGNVVTSSNPADNLYEVLTGNLGSAPQPIEIVDVDELSDWRDRCVALDYTVNMVIEGRMYTDVIAAICSTGYARVRRNEKWGVIMDRDRSAEAPVQIFTPRNMANFSWTKAFADQPTGIRAAFQNADEDYAADEIFIFTDPRNQDANRLEQFQYDGLVFEQDIERRARFDIQQSQLRLTFYSGDADIESLICERGDLVGVQHDIIRRRAGFSKVNAVLKVAGDVVGLLLDGTVPVLTTESIFDVAALFDTPNAFDLGQRTGAAIRLKQDEGILLKEITADVNDHTTRVSFVEPFADPGDELGDDCLVSVGPIGREFRRLLIHSIRPKNDFQVTLTMVDEASELFQ